MTVTPSQALAAHLAALDDAELRRLVRARLDSLTHPPRGAAELASQLQRAHSVRVALERLDRPTAAVLARLSARSGSACSREDLLAALGPASATVLDGALHTLVGLGLAWPAAPETAGWHGCGWVDHLLPGLAREGFPAEASPVPEGAAEQDERPAAGAVTQLVERVDGLLRAAAETPLGRVQTGGVAVKDVRRVAKALRVAPDEVAVAVQLAADAGLLSAQPEVYPSPVVHPLTPGPGEGAWQRATLAERAGRLAAAWVAGVSHLQDLGIGREAVRPLEWAAGYRREGRPLRLAVLEVAAGRPVLLGPGLLAALSWHRPLVPADHGGLTALAADAEALGLTLGGRLTAAGRAASRALAEGVAEPAELAARVAAAWDRLLPAAVGRVLLGPDLTAVVPGQPTPALRQLLDVASEGETSGAAVTRRFTRASLGRALDAGWTGPDLLAALAEAAGAPAPGTLAALVQDAVRQHGRVRLAPAATVVVCADDALAREVAGDRGLRGTDLRRVAPGVLVSATLPPEVLLGRLRAAGRLPVLQDGDGAVVQVTHGTTGTKQEPSLPPPAGWTSGGVGPGVDVEEVVAAVRRAPEPGPAWDGPGGGWPPGPSGGRVEVWDDDLDLLDDPWAAPPDDEQDMQEEALAALSEVLRGSRLPTQDVGLLVRLLRQDVPVAWHWAGVGGLHSVVGWLVSFDHEHLGVQDASTGQVSRVPLGALLAVGPEL